MRASDTWVCVADGAHARFYQCDGPGRDLEPVIDFGIARHGAPFSQRLAGQLDRAARAHCYEHLVLVGPQSTMREVEDCMSDQTRTMIVGEIPRDLQRASPHELFCHVMAYLPH